MTGTIQAPKWAAHYLTIPFKDRGIDHAGCDCWGLVRLIMFEQCDIVLPLYPGISPGATYAKLKAIVGAARSEEWAEITTGNETTFDVALMKGHIEDINDTGRIVAAPIHIGLVVGRHTLIHIEKGSNVSLANYNTHMRLKNRIHGFYRYRGPKCSLN